jgi:hypothetical protein
LLLKLINLAFISSYNFVPGRDGSEQGRDQGEIRDRDHLDGGARDHGEGQDDHEVCREEGAGLGHSIKAQDTGGGRGAQELASEGAEPATAASDKLAGRKKIGHCSKVQVIY